MHKKIFTGIVSAIVILVSLIACAKTVTKEDLWLCQNGTWIKHGNPVDSQPTTECGNLKDQIKVTLPKEDEIVKSPLEITGQAKGAWYFEASFPVKLLDAKNNVIAQAPAKAEGEWMTDKFVSFKATLEFDKPQTDTGLLILSRDNPSGLPENNAYITIPVKFDENTVSTVPVKVYFSNTDQDPETEFCEKTYAVTREIPKTKSIARAAIEELLKGPTDSEKTDGSATQINEGVKIQKLSIVRGIAYIDFNQALQDKVGGSCKVAAIHSQITETLKQFSSVKNVVISINGDSKTILQP